MRDMCKGSRGWVGRAVEVNRGVGRGDGSGLLVTSIGMGDVKSVGFQQESAQWGCGVTWY